MSSISIPSMVMQALLDPGLPKKKHILLCLLFVSCTLLFLGSVMCSLCLRGLY